jgi:hypothetical protein
VRNSSPNVAWRCGGTAAEPGGIAMQEQSLFIEALEKEDPEERAAFLTQACGGDDAMRERIERLLARHEKAGSFMDGTSADLRATLDETMRERPGTVLEGRYKLLEEIGEGGMGTVFMAEQTKSVQRKVAIKVIKPGMDSKHGRRPLRSRAAGAGNDGPRQHRPRLRWRHHGSGPAVFRHGTGPRRAHHQVLRR